jgi:hypothetical protein
MMMESRSTNALSAKHQLRRSGRWNTLQNNAQDAGAPILHLKRQGFIMTKEKIGEGVQQLWE